VTVQAMEVEHVQLMKNARKLLKWPVITVEIA
jgi:hypothetical protein